MASSEKSFNQKSSNELIISMSIEKMFSDSIVRALAKYAGTGDLENIDTLIQQGVDVNSKGIQGVTPLFWSLRSENFAGFKKLLELGANPNLIFADSSVIHWAARYKDTRFLRLALEYNGDPDLYAGKPKKTPIFNTIGVEGGDNLPALKLLLDANADINAITGNEQIFGISMGGVTPLLAAADIVRFDIVYFLLEAGAEFQITDDTGRDLISRISAVQGRFPKGSKQSAFLAKVIDWLSEKGIKI